MIDQLNKLRQIVPEITHLLEERISFLELINLEGPIGRRKLSQRFNLSQRQVLSTIGILGDLGLVTLTSSGAVLTDEGKQVLSEYESVLDGKRQHLAFEKEIADMLGIQKVRIAINEDEVFAFAADELNRHLSEVSILGITGGSSVAGVVDKVRAKTCSHLEIVPARGSIGEDVQTQSNTLCEKLASKLSAKSYALHSPDFLSQDSIESMRKEPVIANVYEKMLTMDLLLFGIGRADEMAKRRAMGQTFLDKLDHLEAKAEAFGYYFNKAGNIVNKLDTMGISLSKYKSLEKLIAVSYGEKKAEAIVSVSQINRHLVLITDWDCAKKIEKIGGSNG